MSGVDLMSVPAAERTDTQLVADYLGGEGRAFDVLYRRYFEQIVEWLVRWTDDPALAEDLAQDTMVRVLRYADSFDQDRPLEPWLKTIAERVLITHQRNHHDGEPLDDQYEDEGEHDDRLHGIELRPTVDRILKRLCDRHQVALHLRYIRDWSSRHVADFLTLNPNACNQLVFRARRSARKACSDVDKTGTSEDPR